MFGIRRRLACSSEFVKDHRCGDAENGADEGLGTQRERGTEAFSQGANLESTGWPRSDAENDAAHCAASHFIACFGEDDRALHHAKGGLADAGSLRGQGAIDPDCGVGSLSAERAAG